MAKGSEALAGGALAGEVRQQSFGNEVAPTGINALERVRVFMSSKLFV